MIQLPSPGWRLAALFKVGVRIVVARCKSPRASMKICLSDASVPLTATRLWTSPFVRRRAFPHRLDGRSDPLWFRAHPEFLIGPEGAQQVWGVEFQRFQHTNRYH